MESYYKHEQEEMNKTRKAITKLHSKSTTPLLTQRLVLAVWGMPTDTGETALCAPAASKATSHGESEGYKSLAVRCNHQTREETCTKNNKPPAHHDLSGPCLLEALHEPA